MSRSATGCRGTTVPLAGEHEPGLRRVSLLHELTRPRVLPFERRGTRWELGLDPPAADRFEYLLELAMPDGTIYKGTRWLRSDNLRVLIGRAQLEQSLGTLPGKRP